MTVAQAQALVLAEACRQAVTHFAEQGLDIPSDAAAGIADELATVVQLLRIAKAQEVIAA